MRILIAEDNPDNLDMLRRRLERKGFEIESAMDGDAAVASVVKNTPDLVLMDISMPKMSGLDATKAIRALSGAVSEIPIIALTAHAMARDREDCFAAGCNDFATKPVDFTQLLEKIRNVNERLR